MIQSAQPKGREKTLKRFGYTIDKWGNAYKIDEERGGMNVMLKEENYSTLYWIVGLQIEKAHRVKGW